MVADFCSCVVSLSVTDMPPTEFYRHVNFVWFNRSKVGKNKNNQHLRCGLFFSTIYSCFFSEAVPPVNHSIRVAMFVTISSVANS